MRLRPLAAIVLVAVACAARPSESPEDPSSELGEVLFDCITLNWAWGFEMGGFYVDRDARAVAYGAIDEELLLRLEIGRQHIPEVDLLQLHRNAELVLQLDPQQVASMATLISRAREGEIRREFVAYDAGGSTCVGYLYHPDDRSYERVVIGGRGTERIENRSRAARKLWPWLESLRTQIAEQSRARGRTSGGNDAQEE